MTKVAITYDPKTEKWIALYVGKVMVRVGDTDQKELRPFAFYVTGKAKLKDSAWLGSLSQFFFGGIYDVSFEQREIKWLKPK